MICLTKDNNLNPYFCHMKTLTIFLLSVLLFFLIGSGLGSCTGSDTSSDTTSSEKPVPSLGYSIISTLPHDTSFYTEGLEFYGNSLLESAGQYEKSRLIKSDPASGKIEKQVKLEPKYFGEGISVLHDTLYQMTWRENIVFVYNAKNFQKIGQLSLKGEGWGMTNDGTNLIVSNGSNNLYYYRPSTFQVIRELPVTENGTPALNLNELEYVNGFIYANQWQYNYLLKINPSTGEVVAKIDLSDLVKRVRSDGHSEYLNGIAFNPSTKKFYVTGKNWPQLFEIQFDR
jgi:glutamine cyclotransferase